MRRCGLGFAENIRSPVRNAWGIPEVPPRSLWNSRNIETGPLRKCGRHLVPYSAHIDALLPAGMNVNRLFAVLPQSVIEQILRAGVVGVCAGRWLEHVKNFPP